jgi:glycosyltransferase involved in cell wall biosynthesis
MVVISYGVDLDRFHPEAHARAEARAALGLDDELVVCCVAHFYGPKLLGLRGRPLKGHDVLFEAWRRYRRDGGRGRLLVVGGGFGRGGDASRRALLRRFRVEGDDSVVVVDTVDDVRPYYAAADVSVAPSRSENLGAAAEASAMGVPTIAARVGGLPELVIDGRTGWTFPSEDVSALVGRLFEADAAVRSGASVALGKAALAHAESVIDAHRCAGMFVDALEREVVEHRA